MVVLTTNDMWVTTVTLVTWQVFAFTNKGQLMMDENVCLKAEHGRVVFSRCEDDGPKWAYTEQVVATLDSRYGI